MAAGVATSMPRPASGGQWASQAKVAIAEAVLQHRLHVEQAYEPRHRDLEGQREREHAADRRAGKEIEAARERHAGPGLERLQHDRRVQPEKAAAGEREDPQRGGRRGAMGMAWLKVSSNRRSGVDIDPDCGTRRVGPD